MSTPISLKLLTDAVVASYIHDISTRHGAEDPAAEDRALTQSAGERVSASGPAGVYDRDAGFAPRVSRS